MADPEGPPPPPPEYEPQSSAGSPAAPEVALGPDLIPPAYLPAYQVHLFSGASGSGKTALSAQLISAFLSGGEWLGLKIRQPPFVGLLAADRAWTDHKLWLDAAGVADLPHYSLVDDATVTGKLIRSRRAGDRFDLFKASATKLLRSVGHESWPADSFLIVDPISLFLGGDFLRYDAVYTHLLDLSQWALQHRVTLLGIAHAGKQRGDPKLRYTRPQDRIAGTTAQTGCAGTTLHLAPPTETEEDWYELTLVPHHAPAMTVRLDRADQDGLFWPLSTVTPSRREKRTVELAERVLTQFPSHPEKIHYRELVTRCETALNLKRRSVLKYLTQLHAGGRVLRAERGWWVRAVEKPPA